MVFLDPWFLMILMMINDWRIWRNPALRQRFFYHMHQAKAKPIDVELCIISFARKKMMGSSGMESFLAEKLVGYNVHLQRILSRIVCHGRTRIHLEMEPIGFDLLAILRDFYVVYPDRYLSQKSDIAEIAWTLFFGRESYSHRIECNEQNALIVARVGYQNDNSISGLVLAMLDGDLSYEILSGYPQNDIYYNIAWVIAFLKKYPVPHNANIFPFLKWCYTEMKDFSSNRIQNFLILPSDNISWVSSLLLDAIFAMSEIVGVGTGVPNCQFRKGDPTMEFQFLTDLEIHSWCPISLVFKNKKKAGLMKKKLSLKKKQPVFWEPPLVKSPKSGDLQVVLTPDGLFKLVQDGDITIACSELKDSHPQHFAKIVFADNPTSGFVSMSGPEVKFWAVDNQDVCFQQHKIFLFDTLHLPKVIGFHLMIDVCSMSSKYIVLWSLRTSELIVIPFTFTGSTVSIGEKTIFPFERVRYITLVDETKFKIRFYQKGSYADHSCILDCSGELPILRFG